MSPYQLKILMCIIWSFILMGFIGYSFALLFVLEGVSKLEIAFSCGMVALSFFTLKAIDDTL